MNDREWWDLTLARAMWALFFWAPLAVCVLYAALWIANVIPAPKPTGYCDISSCY